MRRPAPIPFLLTLLLVPGCALGPDPVRPPSAADDLPAFTQAGDGALAASPSIDRWWTAFGDPELDALVDEALGENTDLAAAASRVVAARERLGQARAALAPEATLGAGATRQKSSFVLPGAGRVNPLATTYSDDLTVSWQVDLFGRLRRSKQAALSDLLAEEAGREAVEHTVVSEVVRARVRLATLGRGVALAREIRDSWERTLATVERRYRGGLASALDVHQARENAASARVTVIDVETQLAQARLGLDVLLGRAPGSGPPTGDGVAPLPPLAPVPAGLPADLLDRRPDLRQSELRALAATARIGVAIGDLFPRLSLTGSTGVRSDTASDLLSSEGLVYSAVANLVGPIFDAGRRRAEVRATRAQADEAAARYAGAVLQALREVEDALLRDRAVRDRLDGRRLGETEARAAHRVASERYGRGVETLTRVLETERRLRAAEQALLAAEADAWTARIDLHLALGGRWVEPADGWSGLPASESAPPAVARAASTDPPQETPR